MWGVSITWTYKKSINRATASCDQLIDPNIGMWGERGDFNSSIIETWLRRWNYMVFQKTNLHIIGLNKNLFIGSSTF